MEASSKIFIVAGEASGDTYGAALMEALQKKIPTVTFSGAGGPKMAEVASRQFKLSVEVEAKDTFNKGFDDWIAEAGVLGLWDVLKKYGYFRSKFLALLNQLTEHPPAAIILIDYPGFNLRLAKAIRRRNLPIKIFYYISPQVWAWHKSRIPKMARLLDLMICIFPFEKELYEASGLPTTFAGHPLVEKLMTQQATQEALPREEHLLGLFPGSRDREVRRIFPCMLQAAQRLMTLLPNLHCQVAAATTAHAEMMRTMAEQAGISATVVPIQTPSQQVMSLNRTTIKQTDHFIQSLLPQEVDSERLITITAGDSHNLMQRATFGLVCSGTATLEAACFALPYALVYKVAWLTYVVGRYLIKIPYLGIINILAGRPVVREFIQQQATPAALAKEAFRFLENPEDCQQLAQELTTVVSTLRGQGAYERAAATMIENLCNYQRLRRRC